MPQAQIEVNGAVAYPTNPAGTNMDVPINVVVNLSNNDIGGEVAWIWTLISKPRSSVAAIVPGVGDLATFTPEVEGTYLIRLVVNGTLINQVDVIVRHFLTPDHRVPAAKETTEAGTNDGWALGPVAAGQNDLQDYIIQTMNRGSQCVCVAGEALNVGEFVAVRGRTQIKVGLPGAESVARAYKANASAFAEWAGMAGFVVRKITVGGGPIALGEYCLVQTNGPVLDCITTAGSAVGDPWYLTDVDGVTGATPGTYPLLVGFVATVGGGGTGSVWCVPAFMPSRNVELISASENIAQYDMVTCDGWRVDATDIAHKDNVLGISMVAALLGASFPVLLLGAEMYNAAWAWSAAGVPIFCNPAVPGGLTETRPVGPGQFDRQAGTAMGATEMVLVHQPAIWIP